MAIYKNANLDISVDAVKAQTDNSKPSFQFSTQDKNTAKYTFTVKQNKKPVDLTDVKASVTLYSEDKSVFQSDATVTNAAEGKVEYVIPAEAIRHHGKTRGDLRLTYPNGDVLGGLRFSFNIEQALIDRAAGVIGGVYIRDFEQLKEEIQATADSIKDIDVVRIDTKLNELEQKVEEGGVGVDEQARQEIQEVTAQLADTAKKSDVVSLQTEIPKKADKTETVNLQVQVNNLVVPSGNANAEVSQAHGDIQGNNFSTLKSRLDNIENMALNSVTQLVFSDWERGTIDSTGALVSGTTRIRTANFKNAEIGQKITFIPLNGYKYTIRWYDSAGVLKRFEPGWTTAIQEFIAEYPQYKVVISNAAETDISVDNANNLVINTEVVNEALRDIKTSNAKGKVFSTAGERLDSLEMDLKTFPARNLLTNGDFSGDPAAWSVNEVGYTVSNQKMTVTARATTQEHMIYQRISNPVIGHVYYASVKIENILNSDFRLTLRNFNSKTDPSLKEESFSRVSNVDGVYSSSLKVTGTTDPPRFSFMAHMVKNGQANFTATGNEKYTISHAIVLDLTEIFGVGNEPTKEEVDNLLKKFPNNWFKQTPTLINLSDLAVKTYSAGVIKNRVRDGKIYVEEFGGDGKSDTDTIQDAFNYANGNIVVFAGDKQYQTNKQLVANLAKVRGIEGNNSKIVADLNGVSALKYYGSLNASGSTGPTFAPNEAVQENEMNGFINRLNVKSKTPYLANGIEVGNAIGITVQNCKLYKLKNGLLTSGIARNFIYENNYIYNNAQNGMLFDDVDLHQFQIIGGHISYNYNNIKFIDSDIANAQFTGVSLENNTGNANTGFTESGSLITFESTGVLRKATKHLYEAIMITGCNIQDHNFNNLKPLINMNMPANGVSDVIIGNNLIGNGSINAPEMYLKGVNGAIINNNSFVGYDYARFNTSIKIDGVNKLININNNHLEKPIDYSGATVTKLKITDNMLEGFTMADSNDGNILIANNF